MVSKGRHNRCRATLCTAAVLSLSFGTLTTGSFHGQESTVLMLYPQGRAGTTVATESVHVKMTKIDYSSKHD